MPHNKLRRDIVAFMTLGVDPPDPDPMSLLGRALGALGGPVQEHRPESIKEDGPLRRSDYHGLRVIDGGGMSNIYQDTLCHVSGCIRLGPVSHGPHIFCNDHFGQLMDNIAKESVDPVSAADLLKQARQVVRDIADVILPADLPPMPADLVAQDYKSEPVQSGAEDIGAGVISPSLNAPIDGIGVSDKEDDTDGNR